MKFKIGDIVVTKDRYGWRDKKLTIVGKENFPIQGKVLIIQVEGFVSGYLDGNIRLPESEVTLPSKLEKAMS